MSNQNESHTDNTDNQLHEDLKHYSWVGYMDYELEALTLEELREDFRKIEHLNYQISAAYGNKKHLFDLEKKKSNELRVALAEWRYAARSLFFAVNKSSEWIIAVKTNLAHIAGFTHHMKSVVDTLNINLLESVEGEIMQPIDKIRELLKKDGDMSDIPF